MTTTQAQLRKSQTGEPTTNGGHFGSVMRPESDADLVASTELSQVEFHVLVVDATLAGWPGIENLDDQDKLTHVLTDLLYWSSWAVERKELNTPGVDYQSKECDIIYAWQVGLAAANGDIMEDGPAEPFSSEEVGAMAGEGTVTLPRINKNSRHTAYKDGVLRAHERLSRWNLRQAAMEIDQNSLGDALADLMHWSNAHGTDFDGAFRDSLNRADEHFKH